MSDMAPPLFPIISQDQAVKDFFGENPIRVWPFNEAQECKRPTPYATWQLIYGNPLNSLACVPDTDYFGVQIDVFGATVQEARDGGKVLRNALQNDAYVVSWNGESRDLETRNYRYSFDVDFHTQREE